MSVLWLRNQLMHRFGIKSSSHCFPFFSLVTATKSENSFKMSSLLLVFLAVTSSVSTHGFALDTGFIPHRQCESDNQCDHGFFCYEDSHLCTRCLDCDFYKRKSSWRSCPKKPLDCGACLHGYEEEILHEGKTRDICVPSSQLPSNLSHTIAPDYSVIERIFYAGAITALVLPILYYVFSRKHYIRDGGAVHRDPRREEPPPYRSIELTTLSSANNSEERLSEDHVMCVDQQKDHLVQAVPFQKPAYMEEELLAFDNSQAENSEEPQHGGLMAADDGPLSAVSSVDLHDENTMPSDWTPDENSNSGQMLSFELSDTRETDECEPAVKRQKTSESEPASEDESTTQNLTTCINLFINNNVTIHKPY